MAFYSFQYDSVQIANIIEAPGFLLTPGCKDQYSYPVEGWWWFDTDADASAHFGVPIPSVPVEENTEQSP
jgi:hypothetical protein